MSFGSGSAKITGKGTVALINRKGKPQNALLMEGIKHNLLSVSQLCDQGEKVVISMKDCEIRSSSSGELIAKGIRKLDSVYILNKIQEDKSYVSRADENWLWRKRLGHSFDNLININKKNAIRDIPKIIKPDQVVYGPCRHGKQKRISFKTKEFSTSKPFETIHAYLCGPTSTASL